MKEQIGLGVEKKDIKIVHIMHYSLGKKLYILLKTKKFNGKLENKIPMEYSDIKWFDYNHLPKKLRKKLFRTFKEIEEVYFTVSMLKNNYYYNIREEIFGATVFDLVKGKRYYIESERGKMDFKI